MEASKQDPKELKIECADGVFRTIRFNNPDFTRHGWVREVLEEADDTDKQWHPADDSL